jgi:HD-like signal output (HDOD) protein/GGDEF domain-containing protein
LELIARLRGQFKMYDPAAKLEGLVVRAQQLCSLPTVAMKVLELTSNPQVDTRALKDCIENDPALTCKILRVVNSSLFGLSREVSSLNQALALLGNKPLKLLVLGFSLPPQLFEGLSADCVGRYWRRTLTKAVAARELSEVVWKAPGDEAFIVALLQDVGVLLLIQEIGQPYVAFLERVYGSDADLAKTEIRSVGFSHIELSARLLTQWGLPDTLVEAVGWEPEQQNLSAMSASGQTLAQIVHLAELVARLMLDGRAGVLGELMEVGRRYHDLREAQLEAVVARLEEKVHQLADVLSLQLPDGLNYHDVLLKSQMQMADVAAATAGEMLRHHVSRADAAVDGMLTKEVQSLSRAVCESVPGLGRPAVRSSPTPTPTESFSRNPSLSLVDVPTATAVREAAYQVSDKSVAAASLLNDVEDAVATCRQSRCALSLLLVEIRDFDRIAQARGAEAAERLRWLLEAFCERLAHPDQACFAYGDAGNALILPDCDRRQVVELGNELHANARQVEAVRLGSSEQPFMLNSGAATVSLPPKNFPPKDLIAAADRCLYGSRASGGGIVKSIEIY